MSLDMYLHRKFYVKNWNHTSDEDRHSFTITKGGVPSVIPVGRIIYVLTEEMHWQDANAIHTWFINNIQNGIDDGGEYYVSKSNLRRLLSSVNKVLKNHSKASSALPTSSTLRCNSSNSAYDASYYSYLESTQKVLSVILLADSDVEEFTYQANY